MSADEILKIIQTLPEYIRYIYPGYLSIYVYLFFRGKTMKDNNYVFVKSIAISYIYLWILEWFKHIGWLKRKINIFFLNAPYELKQNACLIVLSVIIAFVFYRIAVSKWISKLFDHLNINTTFYDNEIEMLAEFNEGAWLCVYLKDDEVVYEGSLGYKELEEDRRKYICLNSYYKYFLNSKGKPKVPYIENHDDEPDQTVMIFYDSIKRIEKRA